MSRKVNPARDLENEMKNEHLLLNKTVTQLAVADKEHLLRLKLSEGENVYLEALPCCCSETWWADILGVEYLIGHTIQAIEEILLPNPHDDRGRQEFDRQYGVLIRTELGIVTLIYRNSSNGYYGGSFQITTKLFQEQQDIEWKLIEEDWSA